MANKTYSAELKQTLLANKNIKKVWFDQEGHHYFNAFPKGDAFVVGNRAVTEVTRAKILGDEESSDAKPLDQMKLEELKAVCLKAEYPAEEWKSFTKKSDLVEYISGKQSNQ